MVVSLSSRWSATVNHPTRTTLRVRSSPGRSPSTCIGPAPRHGQPGTSAIDPAQPAIVRASAWQRLASYPEAVDPARLAAAAQDHDPLVRLAALKLARSLELPAGTIPAEVLATAQQAWVREQEFNADRPEAQVNLGQWHATRGDPSPRRRHSTGDPARSAFLPARQSPICSAAAATGG